MLNKNIPMHLIAIESKLRSEKLYKRQLALPEGKSTQNIEKSKAANISSSIGSAASKNQNESIKVLKSWLSNNIIWYTQSEILNRAGIVSGSTGARIKRFLITNRYIIEHSIQKAKTKLSVWEPIEKAFEVTGNIKPRPRSKGGGYLHDFCSFHLKEYGKAHDYTVDVEHYLSNGKSVDLVYRNPDRIIFIEIAITPPLEKEISNIIKDFSTDFIPDELMIACKDGKMKNALQTLINEDSKIGPYRNKIKVILAGDYISIENKGE